MTSSTGLSANVRPRTSQPTCWRASTTAKRAGSCCDACVRWSAPLNPRVVRPRTAGITVALTYQGLKALGVPQASLESFAPEFRQGMAARAADLGDVGDSSPDRWEPPLGTPDVHVAIAILSPDAERLEALLDGARRTYQHMTGVEVIWRQDCYQLPTGRTSFGFKDGIGQPAIEGSGVPGSNPLETPIRPGEFILGYPDETGALPPMPVPEILGRNGTYIAFRKLHTRVAAYRQYLRANASNRDEEKRLGAKMVGRWQSGAPLALCPDLDDPELGADPEAKQPVPLRRRPGRFPLSGRGPRPARQPPGRP